MLVPSFSAAPVSPTNPTGVPSTIGGSDIEYSAGGPNPGTAVNTGHGGNSEGGNAQSGVVIIRYKYQN